MSPQESPRKVVTQANRVAMHYFISGSLRFKSQVFETFIIEALSVHFVSRKVKASAVIRRSQHTGERTEFYCKNTCSKLIDSALLNYSSSVVKWLKEQRWAQSLFS